MTPVRRGWLAVACTVWLAGALTGCFRQHVVYTFDPHGQVSIESSVVLETALLGEAMSAAEETDFINEVLFGGLGNRVIEQRADGSWISSGPAVPVPALGEVLDGQGMRFEPVPGGWRFTSTPEDGWFDVADTIRSECGSLAGTPAERSDASGLCEQMVWMLVDPQGGQRPDDLPADLPQGLGMTRDELAGFVLLLRAQLEKLRVQVDLQGSVSDVEGFAPLAGGGWRVEGSLHELMGRTLGWTVLAETAPAGPRAAGTGRGAGQVLGPVPTPEVQALEDVSGTDGSEVAYALLAALPAGGVVLGVVVACMPDGGLEAAAEFGGYPPDGRTVQLAVRTADGRIERFGPVERGTPGSGVHAPRVRDPTEAWRFAAAALGEGSLVSNGFRSLWNRAGPADNGAARTRLRDCMQK